MMTPLEQLAVTMALKKFVTDAEKRIRSECDAELLEGYESKGYKKQELRLNGKTVGEFIVAMAKPGYVISDPEAFSEFGLSYGLAEERRSINPFMMERAIEILEEQLSPEEFEQFVKTETVPVDGWEAGLNMVGDVVTYMDSGLTVPGVSYVPEHPKNTMVKGCKPEDVLPVVQQLGGLDRVLALGDGNE